MPICNNALKVASIAERLAWEGRRRVLDGHEVVIVLSKEAEQMIAELLAISYLLSDMQDEWRAAD